MANNKVTIIPSKINPLTHLNINSFTKKRVAGYARVSTDHDEQFTSYEAQVDYYTKYIKANPEWEFINVYTDEGISGTNTKKRIGFNKMMDDALNGNIDLIITKSVSRFARNTVDTLVNIRKLKEKGVEVYFEKENIYTLDSKGELLLTIMSSIAQEESRSISENVKWGIRKSFSDGKMFIPYSKFLGYKKDENGNVVIIPDEAKIVHRIYALFLEGKLQNHIADILTNEHIPTPSGKDKWFYSTINSILSNEKYKGSALLQKNYSVDFLTKKFKKNEGEIPQYFVEESHPAIIDTYEWEQVQLERTIRNNTPDKPHKTSILCSRIYCEECGKAYGMKVWHSNDKYRKVIWQCNNKFKGDHKCLTPHIDDTRLKELFVTAFNQLFKDKDAIIKDFESVKDILLKVTNEEALNDLKNELTIVSSLAKEHVERVCKEDSENDAYLKEYESLVTRYKTAEDKYDKEIEANEIKKAKAMELTLFINELKSCESVISEFNEVLFHHTIAKGIVTSDGHIIFHIKNGKTITLEI